MPAQGIVAEPWLGPACKALADLGLQVSGELGERPLFRVPVSLGGELQDRGPTSEETPDLLRGSLGLATGGKHQHGVSSHSLKATCLAWSCRFGLDAESRSILGRHAASATCTAAIYSRDLSAAPCSALARMLFEVAMGRFNPEAPANAFFKDPAGGTAKVEQVDSSGEEGESCVVNRVCAPVSSHSSQRSSEAESDSESGGTSEDPAGSTRAVSAERSPSGLGPEVPGSAEKREGPSRPARVEEAWLCHRASGKLHLLQGQRVPRLAQVLACGRSRTAQYREAGEGDLGNIECQPCKRRMA